jgi:tetratricopeptide (TPR) repeat protein
MNQLRSAYQKLAWINLLLGNKKKYIDWIHYCKTTGANLTDEDKEATEEFRTGDAPNPVLLRSRLLFDGGYYKEALNEIAGKSIHYFPRFKDQLEVTYRLARIFQRLSLNDKAIPLFEETIKNGASSKYYFAANSALLLGNTFEEKNESDKAENYYRICLSMRNHGYQNSIDQKAKAGLARLNVK